MPDDIKALFETMMDRDYGFYDYTGTGDYIEGALGGYQYDQITSAQAAQWLKAKGQPMTDQAPALVSRGQSRQPARRDVAQHRPSRPAGPGQGRQAQDRRSCRTTVSTSRNGTASRCRRRGSSRSTRRAASPAHRIYHAGQRLPDGADPQRGMARPHAPELLLQCHSRRRPADRPGPRSARPARAHRQDHRDLHFRPRRAAGLARRPVRQGHDGLPPAEPRADAGRPSRDQGRPALPARPPRISTSCRPSSP